MAAPQNGAPRDAPNLRNFAALFALSVPLLFGCWLIFTATFSNAELITGAAVAVLGGVAICVTERAAHSHFRPRLRDWLEAIWIPWLLLQGTCALLLVAIRDLSGGTKTISAFRMARFDAGETCDRRDTGRRVLAVLYATATPTTIVLGINTPERVLVFHAIDDSGISTMTRNLGAIAA